MYDNVNKIDERHYEEFLQNEGRTNITSYGIAFCKKRCRVAIKE